jgi:hypothetical protein
MSSSLLLPFNTSTISNTLNPEDRAAQRKALVAPFSEKFDANPEDVLQFIENFTQCCKETGIIEDFNFIIKEKLPLSDVDMDDTIARTQWLTDSHHFTMGNLPIDYSKATLENVKQARDSLLHDLSLLKCVPGPKKQPKASRHWFLSKIINGSTLY